MNSATAIVRRAAIGTAAGSMSHTGHLRLNWTVRAMSGLRSIATELRTSLEIRIEPEADVIRDPRPIPSENLCAKVLVRVGAIRGLNLRGDRREEAVDSDDPYRIFRSAFASKTVRSAWTKSYGDQFWEASDPPLSQATIDDIKFLTERLRPGSETKLADLGCGSGCVGRYLAKDFDTDVEGIDANPLAIRMADELTVTSGTAQRLRFKTADISNTGWSDHSFDGALSMDVLLFVPDKRAALQEVARILKLGGRFVGTTWELRADSAALSAPAFDEYPSAFRDAGFTIEVYEETRNWKSLLTNALAALVASEDAVRKEVGGPRAEWLLAWARTRPAELDHSRRVRFSVQRSV